MLPTVVMRRIVFFCGLIMGFGTPLAWVAPGEEIVLGPDSSRIQSSPTSHSPSSPNHYDPDIGWRMPAGFTFIIKYIWPDLLRFPNGATDHAAEGLITNVAQDWMGELSQDTIESLFFLGAQYGHELRHQDHFYVTDLERFLRELGTLETLYPNTTQTACGILFNLLHKGHIKSWERQKKCLHTAANLFQQTQNEAQTSCIINYLYQFTSSRTALDKFYATLELLKDITTFFPFNYQHVLEEIADQTHSVDASSDYVPFLQGFLAGHRVALKYPSQSPLSSPRASTPSVHSHSSDTMTPSSHPFYRPGSGMVFESPPSATRENANVTLTHEEGQSPPPLAFLTEPEPQEPRPYPVSPSLPLGMERYSYSVPAQLSQPTSEIPPETTGFYPYSPSLPLWDPHT